MRPSSVALDRTFKRQYVLHFLLYEVRFGRKGEAYTESKIANVTSHILMEWRSRINSGKGLEEGSWAQWPPGNNRFDSMTLPNSTIE